MKRYFYQGNACQSEQMKSYILEYITIIYLNLLELDTKLETLPQGNISLAMLEQYWYNKWKNSVSNLGTRASLVQKKKKKKSNEHCVKHIYSIWNSSTIVPVVPTTSFLIMTLVDFSLVSSRDISFATQRPPPVFLDPISTSLSTSYLSTYSEMEIVLL